MSKVCFIFILLCAVTGRAFLTQRSSMRWSATRMTAVTWSSSFNNPRLEDLLYTASQESERLSVQNIFKALSADEEFQNKYWQKQPLHITKRLPNLVGAFTMEDVRKAVDEGFLEAGRGSFQQDKTGWKMAQVSKPRGTSFEDAKLRFDDVTMAMKETSGTVVFNSAGGFIPQMAIACLETVNAFQMPNAMNVYLTNPGQQTSAPPHTDKQDVFVLQTQGSKHWRVFAPPDPSKLPRADPYARGKGTDMLLLSELGEPLLDTVVSAGQMLYVPAGYPHTTGTVPIYLLLTTYTNIPIPTYLSPRCDYFRLNQIILSLFI